MEIKGKKIAEYEQAMDNKDIAIHENKVEKRLCTPSLWNEKQ